MKHRTPLAAAAMPAMTFNPAYASSLYGAIGYLNLDLKLADSPTSRERLGRSVIGCELHPQLAVEGMLGRGIGGDAPAVNELMGIFVKPNTLGLGIDFELTVAVGNCC